MKKDEPTGPNKPSETEPETKTTSAQTSNVLRMPLNIAIALLPSQKSLEMVRPAWAATSPKRP